MDPASDPSDRPLTNLDNAAGKTKAAPILLFDFDIVLFTH